ncbi:hypothetical protein NFJ02_08g138900 [Pycnococcus provasolii]
MRTSSHTSTCLRLMPTRSAQSLSCARDQISSTSCARVRCRNALRRAS